MTEKRVYEASFHINPVLSEEKLEAKFQGLKEVIEKAAGEPISEEFPSRIRLAYPLEGEVGGEKKVFTEAFFGWIKFEGSKEALKAFTDAMESDDSIVRFIALKTVREDTYIPREKAGFSPERPIIEDDSSSEEPKEAVELTEEGKRELDAALEQMVSEK